MGENEQGGMLRTVVAIGIIAMIAAFVIFAVIGLNGNMKSSLKTSVQNTDLAVYDKDLGMTLIGNNGKLASITGNSDFIKNANMAYIDGHELDKITTNYPTKVWNGPADDRLGILFEMYPDSNKVKYLLSESNSDYLYVSVDYTIKNAKSVSYAQAQSLGLDTQRVVAIQRDHPSSLNLGTRSNSYNWTNNAVTDFNGDMHGTLTLKQPKSKIGSTFEVYVVISNINYDYIKIDNLHISNANVFE